uniref:Caenorhabditis elegans ly-6-related family-containing protein n=1 Tax=Dracunculus medinensis TaxID=318479 RepID=A0A0N4UI63_DRAME
LLAIVSDGAHYGAFFDNPRVLQEEINILPIFKCDINTAKTQICRDSCFSLNVTSQQGIGRSLLFGISRGCSTNILTKDRMVKGHRCSNINVILKTKPQYVVFANYCFCTGNKCNKIPEIFKPSPITTVTNTDKPSINFSAYIRYENKSMRYFYSIYHFFIFSISNLFLMNFL